MKINKNPLTIRGLLKRCWLFSYRVPIETVGALVPAPLSLATHRGFAFWNIVVCRVESLRPAPLPAMVGLGYWHLAYRLCVHAKLRTGGKVEGLYFVRSESDSALIARLGNCMTDFAFRPARVAVNEDSAMISAQIISTDGTARFSIARKQPVVLADGSLFDSIDEAAAFFKYRPCALAPAGEGKVQVVRVERDETRWRCRPVCVESAEWPALLGAGAKLELCFEVDPIEYQWNRGETWEVAA